MDLKEKELQKILYRDKSEAEAKQFYSKQLELLTDIVNYGTNLIVRAYDSSKNKMTDVIVLSVLLKQVVSMIDAIQVLVSKGAAPAAFLHTRVAYEASVYIDWILKSDSEEKANCYYVSNLRKSRYWANRFVNGTIEKQQLSIDIEDMKEYLNLHNEEITKIAKADLEEINRILNQETFAKFNKLLESKKNKKTGVETYWYQAFGFNSFRQIAKDVKRLTEYEFFYTSSSDFAHSASYRNHIRFKKGIVIFEPIRHLEECKTLLQFAIFLTIGTYRKIIQHYRQGEVPNFRKKYLTEWRKDSFNLLKVDYREPDKTK
jgi:hypothetical protein